MYALRPLVEHNTADSVACEINDRVYSHPGDRAGKVAAGHLALEMQGCTVPLQRSRRHPPEPGQHGL